MSQKLPCTEIPIQNANISTLDPHNFFSAGFCCTKFWESFFLPESNLELKRWALYYLRNFGQKSCSPLTLTLFPQARRMIFLFPQAWRMIASSQRPLPSLFGSCWYLHMGYTRNVNERHFCDIAYTVLSSLLLVCSVFVCLVFASILGLRRQLITREDWNYPQHCLWLLISVFPLLRCGRTVATCLSSPTSGCSKISIFLLPL